MLEDENIIGWFKCIKDWFKKKHLLHTWGQWEIVNESWGRTGHGKDYDFIKTFQVRRCEVCGKRHKEKY